MTNWMLDILITHKRLRGLNERQLRELIESAGDIESLRIIKNHLEGGSFRYAHIQNSAGDMIERCRERAGEILWRQHEEEARRLFLERVGNPLDAESSRNHTLASTKV